MAETSAAIREGALEDEGVRRLRAMPGVGPVTAMAIRAFRPGARGFENGRAFASRLGPVPRRSSTGDRTGPGRVADTGRAAISAAAVHRMTISPWPVAETAHVASSANVSAPIAGVSAPIAGVSPPRPGS